MRSDPRPVSYREALGILEGRGFGIKPDLSRIQELTRLLDHPERSYPTIHLTGTNGKSSTARMIGWILANHGIKTGVYTSPHLQTVRERFLLIGDAGEEVAADYISKEEFAEIFGYLLPFVRQIEAERDETVTYFELCVAMAFDWMANRTVGCGIYEVGLGGRWDATNVIQSDVAVITRVDVDHVDRLGPTPLDAAREKVGIIKHGSRVVSGRQLPEVHELIAETASGLESPLLILDRDFAIRSDELAHRGRLLSVQGSEALYDDLLVPLHGSHQSVNAAMAIAASEQFLGRALDGGALRKALLEVRSPGRLEVVGHEPLVVLDGAHNAEGALALSAALRESFPNRRPTFVMGVSKDKDFEGILRPLLPLCESVIFTASTAKPIDPGELVRVAERLGVASKVAPTVGEAVDAAIQAAGKQGMVLVCGSLFVVADARDHLVGPLD